MHAVPSAHRFYVGTVVRGEASSDAERSSPKAVRALAALRAADSPRGLLCILHLQPASCVVRRAPSALLAESAPRPPWRSRYYIATVAAHLIIPLPCILQNALVAFTCRGLYTWLGFRFSWFDGSGFGVFADREVVFEAAKGLSQVRF